MDVIFSARNKLSRIVNAVNKRANRTSQANYTECRVKHGMKFVSCTKGTVYKIPFTCGHSYIGQTRRCLNIRLREHHSSLKGGAYSHLAVHCRECGCEPRFSDTNILYTHQDQLAREVVEAYHIAKQKPVCVSQPSVNLVDSEIAFFGLGMIRREEKEEATTNW